MSGDKPFRCATPSPRWASGGDYRRCRVVGVRHAETIAELGGIPWLVDIDAARAEAAAAG